VPHLRLWLEKSAQNRGKVKTLQSDASHIFSKNIYILRRRVGFHYRVHLFNPSAFSCFYRVKHRKHCRIFCTHKLRLKVPPMLCPFILRRHAYSLQRPPVEHYCDWPFIFIPVVSLSTVLLLDEVHMSLSKSSCLINSTFPFKNKTWLPPECNGNISFASPY